jgi:glycosyltransferase involved in cell wall biosynthesis
MGPDGVRRSSNLLSGDHVNILCLSTWYPFPPDNGSKIRAYYLLDALRHHNVTLVAFDANAKPVPNKYGREMQELRVVSVDDDPFRSVNKSRLVTYLSPSPLAFQSSAKMRAAVERTAKSAAWDAVITVQMPVAQYAIPFLQIPKILDMDTSLSYQLRERHHAEHGLLGRLSTWASWQKAVHYERRVLRQLDACVVASALELGYLRKLMGDSRCDLSAAPNGVDCRHNHPGLAEPRPNALIYNGALTYSANYDAMQWFLACIYPRIKNTVPDITLAITGSTQGVDMTKLALDDTVTLSGYVDDIRCLVAAASVCVVPIRQGGGTRLKILEAMALGTPVVATAKGAEGLDVVDGEHLLVADDPEAFARRTVELLGNPGLRASLTTNARRLVEARYSWEAIGRRFADLVEATARGRSI